MGIQVVSSDKDLSLAGGDSKRSHPGHCIANCLARLEGIDETGMLRSKARIPIDFAEIKLEFTSRFVNRNIQVIRPCEDFVRKCSKHRLCPNIKGLVDDSGDCGVFVDENLPNQMFIRQIWSTQIDMRL